MNSCCRYILCLVLLVGSYLPAIAQDTTQYVADTTQYATDSSSYEEDYDSTYVPEQVVMSVEDWQQLTSDSVFNYRNEREAEIKMKPNRDKTAFEKAFNNIISFIFSGVGRFIFWLLVILVLAYVVYQIFKGDVSFVLSKKVKEKVEVSIEQLSAEDLLSADWEAKTEKAVQAGDKRLATRYVFLRTIQLLHQQQHIHYSIDKTNYDYYRAIEKPELKALYKQLLMRYEYAWFGYFAVSEEDWVNTTKLLRELKEQL